MDVILYILSENTAHWTAWNSVYPAWQDKGLSRRCKDLDWYYQTPFNIYVWNVKPVLNCYVFLTWITLLLYTISSQNGNSYRIIINLLWFLKWVYLSWNMEWFYLLFWGNTCASYCSSHVVFPAVKQKYMVVVLSTCPLVDNGSFIWW